MASLNSVWDRMMRRRRGANGAAGAIEKPVPEQRIGVAPQVGAAPTLTEQRILNDDTVYSIYALFCNVLLGSGWRFEGGDAERLAPLLDQVTSAQGFPQLLDELAASPFQRLAVAEVLWRTDQGAGAWVPEGYRVMPLSAVSIDLDESANPERVWVTTTGGRQEIQPASAIVHRWRPTFAKPLGQSVYDRLKEVVDYKRRADVAIIRYLERFSAPTVIGWYAPNTSSAKQSELLTALKGLVSASVGVLPGPKGEDGNLIELLETKGTSGGIGVATDVLATFERRIARAVLGSVLAMFESQFGTRAQADVHLQLLESVIRSYQADIEQPVNEQLMKRVLEFNVGQPVDVRWSLNAPSFADMQELGQWVSDLAQAGFLNPEEDAPAVRSLFGLETPKGWSPAAPEPAPVPAPGPEDPAAEDEPEDDEPEDGEEA